MYNLVDTMLQQPGAQFRWKMMTKEQGLIGYGEGVVNFATGQVVSDDHFVMTDTQSAQVGPQATNETTARTLLVGNTIYVQAPVNDDEWIALEMEHGGIVSTVLAPLLWLRASTLGQSSTVPEPGRHEVHIDLAEFIALHDISERPAVKWTLEFGRFGMSQQEVTASVWLNDSGLVERMVTHLPPGISGIIPVGFEGVEQDTKLRWLQRPPPVFPTPDAPMRASARQYLRDTLAESGIEGWSEDLD